MASNDKTYPGQLSRYNELRVAREVFEQGTGEGESHVPADPAVVASLSIAEELAGLAYILDGIRYSVRKQA